jgi:hypothetical protein
MLVVQVTGAALSKEHAPWHVSREPWPGTDHGGQVT